MREKDNSNLEGQWVAGSSRGHSQAKAAQGVNNLFEINLTFNILNKNLGKS